MAYRIEYRYPGSPTGGVWHELRDVNGEPCIRATAAEATAWVEQQQGIDAMDGTPRDYRLVEVVCEDVDA